MDQARARLSAYTGTPKAGTVLADLAAVVAEAEITQKALHAAEQRAAQARKDERQLAEDMARDAGQERAAHERQVAEVTAEANRLRSMLAATQQEAATHKTAAAGLAEQLAAAQQQATQRLLEAHERVTEAEDERDRLAAQVQQLHDLHKECRTDGPQGYHWCAGDGFSWPCRTVRIIGQSPSTSDTTEAGQ